MDLKMMNFLLSQQSGYTKYLYLICVCDCKSKDKHWVKKQWPLRENRMAEEKNVIDETLVDRNKIILPPLEIRFNETACKKRLLWLYWLKISRAEHWETNGRYFCKSGNSWEIDISKIQWIRLRQIKGLCSVVLRNWEQ